MELLEKLEKSIKKNQQSNAFCINNEFFTYRQLRKEISKIRVQIRKVSSLSEKLVGLVTNDDMSTYASILALWVEGKAYVPVNPQSPIKRNITIFKLTEISLVIDSTLDSMYSDQYDIMNPYQLLDEEIEDVPKKIDSNDLAYILFTSGTTGLPKGVPISFKNLNALVDSIDAEEEFELISSDRCLQMFELTFDFSVVTYLFPLLAGACIYTIPKGAIKYLYVYKLIEEHKLTVLTMVPSIINYLRPYFTEIHAPDVRYCSFGGGALFNDIAKEWSACLPNCKIFNYYGPTEFTVYSGFYPYTVDKREKAHNGIIAIGRPQKGVRYCVVDKKNNEVGAMFIGELCLAGEQLTPGYWRNPERNSHSFFEKEEHDGQIRYYKTGDLCFKDTDGDYLYVGRSDFQVKIRGYRVELGEIEYHAKKISSKKVNIVALDIDNRLGNKEIGLAIASVPFDVENMIAYLKTKLPDYMIPSEIHFLPDFPHNQNGKIDRKQLKAYFKN